MSVELTAKQSEWLEHVRRASEQGLALRAYAAQYGLSMAALSKAKQTLMNCGAWPRTTQRTGMKRPSKQLTSPAAFVPVRLSTDAAHLSMPCHLRHASGWVMECEALPPAAWLNALVQVNHAAP